MTASAGTTIFFSPPLYLTVNIRPSTLSTVCSPQPLVMVLFGRALHGRKPSLMPRSDSANTVSWMARWLPSACGMGPGADIGARLDVGERPFAHGEHHEIAGQVDLHLAKLVRLDRQHVAVEALDRAGNAHGRRLLR